MNSSLVIKKSIIKNSLAYQFIRTWHAMFYPIESFHDNQQTVGSLNKAKRYRSTFSILSL